jgi:hypothetical protein
MSHFKSLTQMQVRLIHITIQVSPTGLERILQAWAGVPMSACVCVGNSWINPMSDKRDLRQSAAFPASAMLANSASVELSAMVGRYRHL